MKSEKEVLTPVTNLEVSRSLYLDHGPDQSNLQAQDDDQARSSP